MNKIVIIGAGITGLTAANYLHQQNIPFTILEASDKVGGRVKSKNTDGFIIDEGFQVFLTAYPEANKLLNYDDLQLSYFDPGAKILQSDGSSQNVGDPLRKASVLFSSITADIGSIKDKWKLLGLRSKVMKKSIEEIFLSQEMTTASYLESFGMSQKMINRFFQPFFSGIFLEDKLNTSSRMFEFIYKMFSEGYAALPKMGMQAISDQLAGNIPTESIVLNKKVTNVDSNKVMCEDGSAHDFEYCIIATEATEAIKIADAKINTSKVGTTHLHFQSAKKPFGDKLIALNHQKDKKINTISVLNNVQRNYAESGTLISVSLVGLHENAGLDEEIKKEAKHWFPAAMDWQLIDKQDITYALPSQKGVNYNNPPLIKDNLIIAGDHIQNGSMNAAMKNGRQASEIVLKKIQC